MPEDIITLDTNAMTWGDMHVADIDAHLPVKGLISDSDTGMSVTKIVYKAGFTNPTHWHNCSHGVYVLDGIFRTGDNDYGPGSQPSPHFSDHPFCGLISGYDAFLRW